MPRPKRYSSKLVPFSQNLPPYFFSFRYVFIYLYVYVSVLHSCIFQDIFIIPTIKVDIPESVIDRAHRIGSRYLDASSNNYCKSIIIRFTTFRHRTMFYRAKNKLKRGVRIKLDLTKFRYDLLKRAHDHVKEVPFIKFCHADVNCRLKVKFNDDNQKDIFFSSFDDLRDIVDMEI